MSNHQKIYIYTDYVHNDIVLYQRLVDIVGQDNVYFCDANDICNGILNSNTDTLIMPGGADLYFCEKLNGLGNQKIQSFVRNGGGYFGICAGAYYACSSIGFAEHIDGETIAGNRELALYKGRATGPIFDFIQDGDFQKSWKNVVSLKFKEQELMCLYNGGSFFEEGFGETVLARYNELEDNPAAIIEVNYGSGKVILSSPHLECTSENYNKTLYKHNNNNYAYELSLVDELKSFDANIEKIFEILLLKTLKGKKLFWAI